MYLKNNTKIIILKQMKFLDTHFDDYLASNKKCSLHPKINKLYESFPSKIDNLKNVIFYGPKGVGKYTQALTFIKKYSTSELKYEKRLTINSNKENFIIKMSDIHFEVDMSLLGCNSKVLWNDIYSQINDVVSTRFDTTGIILCKYFHKIHSELLDIFYSYMQSQSFNKIKLIFFIITEHVSFIPDNILNNSQIINIPRPTITNYNKCLFPKTSNITPVAFMNIHNNSDSTGQSKLKNISKISDTNKISNIKNITADISCLTNPHECVCNVIIGYIKNPNTITFLSFRDVLYEILIYELDINECIWYILTTLINENLLQNDSISDTLLKTYIFFQYYNNNYRPIYHLENYMYNLITTIHGFKTSS
jgi:hypothetical protein